MRVASLKWEMESKIEFHKSLLSEPLPGRGQPLHLQLQKQLTKSLPVLVSVPYPPCHPSPSCTSFLVAEESFALHLFPEVIKHHIAHFY